MRITDAAAREIQPLGIIKCSFQSIRGMSEVDRKTPGLEKKSDFSEFSSGKAREGRKAAGI